MAIPAPQLLIRQNAALKRAEGLRRDAGKRAKRAASNHEQYVFNEFWRQLAELDSKLTKNRDREEDLVELEAACQHYEDYCRQLDQS